MPADGRPGCAGAPARGLAGDAREGVRARGVEHEQRGDQWPCAAFSRKPFFTSSVRLSTQFLAISTLMPCMNLSDEWEAFVTTAFSFTKWTARSSSSTVTQSLMLRWLAQEVLVTENADRDISSRS